MRNARILFVTVIVLLGFGQGCTMVQTYPLAARPGDTITIAPGSLEGATKSNLTIQYYSDAAPTAPINLTTNIRSVFNITPDRTSPAWTTSYADTITNGSGHGPWQTVIALDLPTSGLPEGSGKLHVSLGTGVMTPDTTHTPEGVDIALAILPGSGTQNLFKYLGLPGNEYQWVNDLDQLKPGHQYVIKPMPDSYGNFTAAKYAAAEFTLNMPVRNISDGLPPTEAELSDQLRVVLDPHPRLDAYQVSLDWRREGDNIIVNVISHKAKVSFRQIRFSVVISDDAEFGFSGPASITGVNYYNVNGDVVSTTAIHTLQDMTI
jgi:hypothetical protein